MSRRRRRGIRCNEFPHPSRVFAPAWAGRGKNLGEGLAVPLIVAGRIAHSVDRRLLGEKQSPPRQQRRFLGPFHGSEAQQAIDQFRIAGIQCVSRPQGGCRRIRLTQRAVHVGKIGQIHRLRRQRSSPLNKGDSLGAPAQAKYGDALQEQGKGVIASHAEHQIRGRQTRRIVAALMRGEGMVQQLRLVSRTLHAACDHDAVIP